MLQEQARLILEWARVTGYTPLKPWFVEQGMPVYKSTDILRCHDDLRNAARIRRETIRGFRDMQKGA
jgi:hypothetical protein